MKERCTGYINNLVRARGYGFIQHDDQMLFFHAQGLLSGCFEDLKEGQLVSFMVTDSPKGTKAIGVKVEQE